jgi:methyl-accepting chemotaxis protein
LRDIVSDIANASAEQATGIDQVNKALAQMDEVTQQNSALVEENAATAKTLEHQSQAKFESTCGVTPHIRRRRLAGGVNHLLIINS